MDVTDGDRFAIAMAKLSQARSAVYEATRIIEHLFESDGCLPTHETNDSVSVGGTLAVGNPVDGLYPGQLPDQIEDVEEDSAECLE